MSLGRALLCAATAAAIALGIGAVAGHPVPAWAAGASLLVYLGIVLIGVLWPRLEMFAKVLWRGPAGCTGVALTFDDGPHPEHTLAILRQLEANKAHATFFVVGEKAERCPELVRDMAHAGHAIGVHGYGHDRLLALRTPATVRRDVARALDAVQSITGERPVLYRPPVGQTNPRIAKVARGLGLTIVGWTVRGRDGVAAPWDLVVRRVTRGLRDGDIVLLHDSPDLGSYVPAAVAAIEPILAALRQRGLMAVRVDEWTSYCDGPSKRKPPA